MNKKERKRKEEKRKKGGKKDYTTNLIYKIFIVLHITKDYV